MTIYSVTLTRIDFYKHREITQWANNRFGCGCHILNESNIEKFLNTYDWVVIQDFIGKDVYYFKNIDYCTEFTLTWLK